MASRGRLFMLMRVGAVLIGTLIMGGLAICVPTAAEAALRVCADPGNMPFSNEAGEGLENKIGAVLAEALGTKAQYYYRPGIERGMTRSTLDADECDVMLDMPVDAERVLTTKALYRTTFVLAYRNDRGLSFKNLDAPRLKKLRVGVYQTSAIREALAEHDVIGNVFIHYLSHDADLVPEHEPGYQVQEMIDGKIDALLRTSLQSPPGLHVDRIELRASTGALLPTTLVTLPGLAGCREHRALVKFLRSA